MRNPLKLLRIYSLLLSLLLLCSCATTPHPCVRVSTSKLPADVAMNKEAGRGGYLIVTLQLESGEELPFLVDTGASATLLAKSLESKLGDQLGAVSLRTLYGNH